MSVVDCRNNSDLWHHIIYPCLLGRVAFTSPTQQLTVSIWPRPMVANQFLLLCSTTHLQKLLVTFEVRVKPPIHLQLRYKRRLASSALTSSQLSSYLSKLKVMAVCHYDVACWAIWDLRMSVASCSGNCWSKLRHTASQQWWATLSGGLFLATVSLPLISAVDLLQLLTCWRSSHNHQSMDDSKHWCDSPLSRLVSIGRIWFESLLRRNLTGAFVQSTLLRQ